MNITKIIGIILLSIGIFCGVYYGIGGLEQLSIDSASPDVNAYIVKNKLVAKSTLQRGPGVGPFPVFGSKKRHVFSIQVKTTDNVTKTLWVERYPGFNSPNYTYILQ